MLRLPFGRPRRGPQFVYAQRDEDLVITLSEGGPPLPVADWIVRVPDVRPALSEVEALLSEGNAGAGEFGINELRLGPKAVASLDAATAAALHLPPSTPLALDLKPRGRIDEEEFVIQSAWVRPGGYPTRADVRGALLISESGPRRIPEPLWSMWNAAQRLANPTDQASRFAALADLRSLWPEDAKESISSDSYLRDLRIHYASGLSLKLKTLTPDRTEFDPLLFSSRAIRDADEALRAPDEELDSLLAPDAQKLFSEDRFRREASSRPAYVLRNGEYVFIDPALRPALGAVRALQEAPEPERREFILNPRKVLREKLGQDVAERIDLDQLFVETDQFSERVAGVDVWRKPVLPWLVPSSTNSWLPEKFGLRVGDDYYVVPSESLVEVTTRVDEAVARGDDAVELGTLLEPAEPGVQSPPSRLPLNEQMIAAIDALRPLTQTFDVSTEQSDCEWNHRLNGKLFLVVRDNFDNVEFAAIRPDTDAVPLEHVEPSPRLGSSLKDHQREGLSWLAQNAAIGRSGCLLADDMGLGKTLQAIAFMAWLQDEAAAGRREAAPFLVVAPTGLLGTWRNEIAKHLSEPRLGEIVPAFGSNLQLLRNEDSFRDRDIETGRAALDSGAWRQAGVVLTTYETLRDYHFSFARTRFGLIIYDEIQKLKNPASQMTRAAKSLNADFILGMTGTPVENRLQDLWSIMDVISPGLLGSSRDFERRHPASSQPALSRLKDQLTGSDEVRPAHMLRRLKSDVLDGLPAKHVHTLEVNMPAVQAAAYRDLVVRAAAARTAGNMGKGGMLSTLASMRGVSLHPIDPRQAPSNLEQYAADSARLSQALSVLEKVASKREKALVFVEDLAMQERLAALIQTHFKLPRSPARINGSVPGLRRQQLVDDFQANPNAFDVMILSPKAGGVGLTITAANHVIHLSRWWNPAVEDQATDRVFRIGQTRDVHVHLPLAVHPEGDLRESSFDLRLNALIERKRKLTRDLFMPPEGSDRDLADLFREVSLDPPSDNYSDLAAAYDATPSDHPAAAPSQPERAEFHSRTLDQAERPVLSVAAPLREARVRFWRLNSGDPRPADEIFELFAGKRLSLVLIHDPYALATANARAAQLSFLEGLKRKVAGLESVKIEYAPDVQGDGDDLYWRRDFGSAYAGLFPAGSVPLSLVRRNVRSRNDDFHDRFVDIDVQHVGGATRRHELSIGRGLEALFNPRRQCTIAYAPPSSI